MSLVVSDGRIGEVCTLQNFRDHRIVELGVGGKQFAKFLRVLHGPETRLLIGRQDALHIRGILPGELLAYVEHTVAVEVHVSIEEPGSTLNLGLRHHRIQAGPRIHVSFFECDPPVGMLQHHHLNILFGQPSFVKRAQQEYVGICPARHGHFLSLEIFDFRDGRVFANDQSGPLGTGVDIDSLDRITVGLSDEGRGPGRGPEVDALAVQQFQRFVAA